MDCLTIHLNLLQPVSYLATFLPGDRLDKLLANLTHLDPCIGNNCTLQRKQALNESDPLFILVFDLVCKSHSARGGNQNLDGVCAYFGMRCLLKRAFRQICCLPLTRGELGDQVSYWTKLLSSWDLVVKTSIIWPHSSLVFHVWIRGYGTIHYQIKWTPHII